MPSDYIHLIDVYETYFHCNGQLSNCHCFQTINIFVSMENTKMSIVRKRTWIPPFFIPSKLVNAYNETNMWKEKNCWIRSWVKKTFSICIMVYGDVKFVVVLDNKVTWIGTIFITEYDRLIDSAYFKRIK